MRRFVVLATVLGILQAGGPRALGGPPAVEAVPVLDGLEQAVVGFTFLPDGRIVYGERFTGNVFFFDPDSGRSRLFFRVPSIEAGGTGGLLALAVHPGYPSRAFVYVYATRDLGAQGVHNQLIRITNSGGVGTRPRVIWSEDPARDSDSRHGGRILFGPDGMLYLVIGDALVPPNAQDLTNDPGKIHRMTGSGGVPPDNPFPGSTIWAYGFRNSVGLAFDPLTGSLWQSENGPECNDEWNLILEGGNYGWGPASDANGCTEPPPAPENTNQDGPNPNLPEEWFTPTTAPVGMTFCVGCGLSGSEGTMFAGEYNTGEIQRAVLTPDRTGISSYTMIYDHPVASVLSIETGPDGFIYFNDFDTIFRLVDG